MFWRHPKSYALELPTPPPPPPLLPASPPPLQPPFNLVPPPPTSQNDSLGALSPPPPATPATSTLNESLRLVEGSLSPSTCDASHINPQRVILTRWGLSLPLHLRRRPHQPSTSHFDSLGALSPLPPATPATSTPPPATPATSTPNESLRLVGGSLSPSTCDYNRVFIIIKYKDLLLRF